MIQKKRVFLIFNFVFLFFIFGSSFSAFAGAQLTGGLWWVYQNGEGDGIGSFADPALIIYADDDGSYGSWGFSGEARFGRGAFTNAASNSSGDNYTIHKAWVSYDFSDNNKIVIGKSQVPFGWKTANFWPGDMLQGGYGDQMDVGLKLTGKRGVIDYDVAVYLQDDWGNTSTDTSDDNGHWGSAVINEETYRKGLTTVFNIDWAATQHHTLGASFQVGDLRDLAAFRQAGEINDKGEHNALDLHYIYARDALTVKYRYIDVTRDFTKLTTCVGSGRCPDSKISNQRNALYLGYSQNKWNYYLEATTASTNGQANTANQSNNGKSVKALAPGVTYNYGPGWFYFEYLWQDGFIDQFGDVGEGDFESFYLSIDFYF